MPESSQGISLRKDTTGTYVRTLFVLFLSTKGTDCLMRLFQSLKRQERNKKEVRSRFPAIDFKQRQLFRAHESEGRLDKRPNQLLSFLIDQLCPPFFLPARTHNGEGGGHN